MRYFLNKLFDELRDDGYIYTEDENGQAMSYGEYAAVNREFEENLLDQILRIGEFEEAADALIDMMDGTIDDVRIFFDSKEYDDFGYNINEDGTVELWSVPETLKEFFDELKEEYEDLHRVYEDEEDYMKVA